MSVSADSPPSGTVVGFGYAGNPLDAHDGLLYIDEIDPSIRGWSGWHGRGSCNPRWRRRTIDIRTDGLADCLTILLAGRIDASLI